MENDENKEFERSDARYSNTEPAPETGDEFNKDFNHPPQDNKKLVAGITGILLGGLGVHKFILGYNTEGLILLGATLACIALSCVVVGAFFVWIPGVIGLIEGIIYLTKSDEEFYRTYQVGKKPWF